ncbi:MAG: hypothetical protein D8M57_04885 [Candidatus Scalindua sp. AMX11]|nr:MAG: hypothetical protein DWQ00_03710 [Candidatus Scalindua sp.]RZV92326.1 MAG: hypothetical protein EX341_04570 [Candidatus Scalindua sp. SCAELEC01]TDE66150.1 MAG: hypothetical protein D8M57_04885 [Candidatus Scalindua sp. AMX11]GJQ59124.1 MAG: hypothetical protein SCALA701_19250 [Candidatus Scalindua sp.]
MSKIKSRTKGSKIKGKMGITLPSFVVSVCVAIFSIAFFMALPHTIYGVVFTVPAGNVDALIKAIDAANANDEGDIINLEAGTYNIMQINNNGTNGANGLPIITSSITITGAGAFTTIIQKGNRNEPFFRIIEVDFPGDLLIEGLTIRGGSVGCGNNEYFSCCGGGILNINGRVGISHSIITDNGATCGGGIANSGGTVTIENSSIAHNVSNDGGGILNEDGTVIISSSSIDNNIAELSDPNEDGFFRSAGFGGGISNRSSDKGNQIATLDIINSSIVRNVAESTFDRGASGGGIGNFSGRIKIINSTIAKNIAERERTKSDQSNGGGISNFFHYGEDTIFLQNTIIADNVADRGPDCSGNGVESLGNNIISFLKFDECDIEFQPGDIIGTSGLGPLKNPGQPGRTHFPLMENSFAIDAANDDVCPATDQVDKPRRDTCDIGAIEFFPVINHLVNLRKDELVTKFDPTPVPGGPAGTFLIRSRFGNSSFRTIHNIFFEVIELSEGNVLLNADGGPGGVGSTMTPQGSATTPFLPGDTGTFQFKIGLLTRDIFQFSVNVLGEADF